MDNDSGFSAIMPIYHPKSPRIMPQKHRIWLSAASKRYQKANNSAFALMNACFFVVDYDMHPCVWEVGWNSSFEAWTDWFFWGFHQKKPDAQIPMMTNTHVNTEPDWIDGNWSTLHSGLTEIYCHAQSHADAISLRSKHSKAQATV